MPLDTPPPSAPTTMLEAINILLRTVGLAPVTSLGEVGSNEAVFQAQQEIEGSLRSLQSLEWHFNTYNEFPVDPQVGTGELLLPDDTLSSAVSPRSVRYDIAQHGKRLYNKRSNSYVFTETVYMEIKRLFPLEWLSESFRQYVIWDACYNFVNNRRGSDSTALRFAQGQLQRAKAAAEDEDVRAQATSLKGTSPHFAPLSRRGSTPVSGGGLDI